MADAAFATAKFPAFTTAELRQKLALAEERSQRAETTEAYLADAALMESIQVEIDRREAVAAGDVSQMTPGERLRHGRELTASTAKAIASL